MWFYMTKAAVLTIEEGLKVDLTLHDFSVTLLTEFAEKIVSPYYSGNMNNAVRGLMRKAIREEQLFFDHVKPG